MVGVVIHVADEEDDDAVVERIEAELEIISAALSAVVQDRINITQDPVLIKASLLAAYQAEIESIGEPEQ